VDQIVAVTVLTALATIHLNFTVSVHTTGSEESIPEVYFYKTEYHYGGDMTDSNVGCTMVSPHILNFHTILPLPETKKKRKGKM
jgi:hypothetical protein